MISVKLSDGSLIPCQNAAEAELVRAAERAVFSGNPDEKLPPETLGDLARAGLNASDSVLYRSTMRKVGE
jgi:hypothetical protein